MKILEPLLKLSEADFKRFQNLLVQESGLYVAADRQETLGTVLAERMEHHHCASPEEYYNLLVSDLRMGEEMKRLIELLTIGETYFFRSFAQFQALEQLVLAPLFHERFQGTRTLTIWSAGCSTGEEPYSLAILLLETLPFPETWAISLLATDVNRDAIRKAQAGVYNSRSVREVPAAWLNKYFTRQGDMYHLHDQVKRMVRFSYLNLIKDSFIQQGAQQVDVLFCRNVTIYFPLDVTKRVIGKFKDALREGGFFFIGGAETMWQISDQFVPVEFTNALLYRKETASDRPAILPFLSAPEPAPEPAIPEETPQRTGGRPLDPISEDSSDDYQVAYDLADQGQYAEAIPLLVRRLERDNLFAPAQYLLGVLHEKTGALEKAAEAFQRVIYMDPTAVPAFIALGNLYRYQGRYSKSRGQFENALKAFGGRTDDEEVPLAKDMTCGYLRTVCLKSIEQLNTVIHHG